MPTSATPLRIDYRIVFVLFVMQVVALWSNLERPAQLPKTQDLTVQISATE